MNPFIGFKFKINLFFKSKLTLHDHYKWCYAWSRVRPATGELEVWLSEHVNTDLHNAMLERLASSLKVGEQRKILLVLDRAGWHTSKHLKVPEGIELFFLPAATPELQPAERLWTLFDEPLIGLAASEIEQIETALIARSQWLFENPNVVSGRALFHWWPEHAPIGLN